MCQVSQLASTHHLLKDLRMGLLLGKPTLLAHAWRHLLRGFHLGLLLGSLLQAMQPPCSSG